MWIFNFFRNLLRNFLRRNVVETNILLISPFDEDKQRFGEALVKSVLGEKAAFTRADAAGLVKMPLGKYRKKDGVPLLYSLRGFHETDADVSRSLLGLSTCQTQTRLEQAFVDRLRLSTSVCVVCLDLAVTPLPYEALAEDLPLLRQTFSNRLVFVGIHGEKLRAWNPRSRRKRIEKWRKLVGSTEFIECSLDECSLDAAGISEVLTAVSKAWNARAAQPTRRIPEHI